MTSKEQVLLGNLINDPEFKNFSADDAKALQQEYFKMQDLEGARVLKTCLEEIAKTAGRGQSYLLFTRSSGHHEVLKVNLEARGFVVTAHDTQREGHNLTIRW